MNHLLHACGESLDWERLLRRFDRYWEVLFSHLLLFHFAYPASRSAVPEWVVRELVHRTEENLAAGDHPVPLCRGNLISRVQYQHDLEELGLENGRRWDERERAADAAGRASTDGGREGFVPAGGGR